MINQHYLFIAFLLFVGSLVAAQDQSDKVQLVEEIDGKRVVLKAVNSSTKPYSVFLMVTTEDFRKSASRPVLKTIAPNSEEVLITLIKLKRDGDATYKTDFVVNEVASALTVEKSHDDFKNKIDKVLNDAESVLIRKADCIFCDRVEAYLRRKRIPYKAYNLEILEASFFKANDISLLSLKKGKPYLKLPAEETFKTVSNLGILQKMIVPLVKN